MSDPPPAKAAGVFGPDRLQRLVDGLGDGYVAFSVELSGAVRYLSPSASRLLGRPLAELRNFQDCLTKSRRNRDAVGNLEAIAGGEQRQTSSIELRHADGHALPMEVQVAAVRDASGRLVGFDGIGRDLNVQDPGARELAQRAERLERELEERDARLRTTAAQLRETHERLSKLSTAVRSLLWIYEPRARCIVFSNGAAGEALERTVEVLLGSEGWWDGIHPEDRQRFDAEWATLQRNGSYAVSHRWRADAGDEWRWLWERGTGQFSASGELDRVFGTTEDVTAMRRRENERLRLEAQVLQAQKMETVGQLGGGVAHDFNNLLTVISAHAELMSAEVEPGSELGSSLAAVEDAVTQATRVSRTLLGFSRPARSRPERIDVGRLVAELARRVQRILPSTIDCRLPELEEAAPFALLDPSRLQQVLLNLALGARESMPADGVLEFAVRLSDDPAHARVRSRSR